MCSHLTHRDVEELQGQNARLIATVRMQNTRLSNIEGDRDDNDDMRVRLSTAQRRLVEIEDSRERQQTFVCTL